MNKIRVRRNGRGLADATTLLISVVMLIATLSCSGPGNIQGIWTGNFIAKDNVQAKVKLTIMPYKTYSILVTTQMNITSPGNDVLPMGSYEMWVESHIEDGAFDVKGKELILSPSSKCRSNYELDIECSPRAVSFDGGGRSIQLGRYVIPISKDTFK
jgi:hypothetical protein